MSCETCGFIKPKGELHKVFDLCFGKKCPDCGVTCFKVFVPEDSDYQFERMPENYVALHVRNYQESKQPIKKKAEKQRNQTDAEFLRLLRDI